MTGSYWGEEELKDNFDSMLEKSRFKAYFALDSFLRILFWKDYGAGYIDPKLQQKIFEVLDTVTTKGPKDEEYHELDMVKTLQVVNEIRQKIGMKKLILGHRFLQEVE